MFAFCSCLISNQDTDGVQYFCLVAKIIKHKTLMIFAGGVVSLCTGMSFTTLFEFFMWMLEETTETVERWQPRTWIALKMLFRLLMAACKALWAAIKTGLLAAARALLAASARLSAAFRDMKAACLVNMAMCGNFLASFWARLAAYVCRRRRHVRRVSPLPPV